MKRQTIIFTGKEKLELIDEPMPKPGPGEVLFKTTHSLISTGTESTVFTRNFGAGTHWDKWAQYPFYPGYLAAGKVVEVGSGLTGWKVGDGVAAHTSHSSHSIAGVAEVPLLANSPEAGNCTPMPMGVRIPEGVSDQDAAWTCLGKIVQIGVRAAEHKLGDVVAIVGLGLLGQLAVQYARLFGASEIIAIDTAPKRLELARQHGATRIIQTTADKALDQVKEFSEGRGADVVYDITGHPAVFAMALPLARKFGTVVLLGDAGNPSLQTLTPDVVTRGLKIVGAHALHPVEFPHSHIRWSALQIDELFLKYISRKQIQVSDLVTHHFNPRNAADAYAMLQRERLTAMGVMFDWD